MNLVDLLNLTPRMAGVVAAFFLLLLVLVDVYASEAGSPGTTPREVVARWAGWAGRYVGVRVTGAPIPFSLGVLLGHWFHPATLPRVLGGFQGLGAVTAIAVSLSLVTGLWAVRGSGDSGREWEWPVSRWSAPLVLLGVITGALLWPVGGR